MYPFMLKKKKKSLQPTDSQYLQVSQKIFVSFNFLRHFPSQYMSKLEANYI